MYAIRSYYADLLDAADDRRRGIRAIGRYARRVDATTAHYVISTATGPAHAARAARPARRPTRHHRRHYPCSPDDRPVITSYSIHYTKLYDQQRCHGNNSKVSAAKPEAIGFQVPGCGHRSVRQSSAGETSLHPVGRAGRRRKSRLHL